MFSSHSIDDVPDGYTSLVHHNSPGRLRGGPAAAPPNVASSSTSSYSSKSSIELVSSLSSVTSCSSSHPPELPPVSELPKKQALLCPQAQAGGALRAVEGGGGATGRGFAEVANAVFELPEHRTSSDVAGAGTAQRVARNAPKPFGMAAKIRFRVLTVSTRQTACNLPKTNMEQKPNYGTEA